MQTQSSALSSHPSVTALALEGLGASVERSFNPPATGMALDQANFRILIVNENMRSADSLKRTLLTLGYPTTLAAYSARRALVAADDFSPAVVLLDLELPDMTGFRLAEMLQAHAHRHVRRLPLVAVAEHNGSDISALAKDAGFVGYLTKPIRPWALTSLLLDLQS